MRATWIVMLTIAMVVGCGKPPAPPAATSAPSPSKPVSAENIETSLAAAQEYITSNELLKAQAILVTLVKQAPNETRGHELLGQVYAMQAEAAAKKGDELAAKSLNDKAYAEYQTAISIEPNSAGVQHSAGVIAIAAGDSSAALRHFQNAGRLDPRNPQYPLFEAQMLIQSHRYDEATAALQRVLKIDPNEAIAHASLAMIAVEQNRFDDALKSMSQARQIEPDDVGLRAQEAKIWRRKGDPKHALELLVGLLPADRAKESVATEIAAAYSALGDHIKSAQAWEHCLKTDPLNPRAWLWQVRTGEELLKAGEREQAHLWLEQAKMAAPNASEVKSLESAFASGK